MEPLRRFTNQREEIDMDKEIIRDTVLTLLMAGGMGLFSHSMSVAIAVTAFGVFLSNIRADIEELK